MTLGEAARSAAGFTAGCGFIAAFGGTGIGRGFLATTCAFTAGFAGTAFAGFLAATTRGGLLGLAVLAAGRGRALVFSTARFLLADAFTLFLAAVFVCAICSISL
jgi:hypothetical protein